jgi:hypothetical protein
MFIRADHQRRVRLAAAAFVAALAAAMSSTPSPAAQSNAPPETFSAIAMANSDVLTGAGRVLIRITRWTGDAERQRIVGQLLERGSDGFLRELQKARPVGNIRTPDSLGYDLRYAYQQRGEDGGRDIVIATDRPISFWEAWNRPRTVDYPFTVIQMHMKPDGTGTGTMSVATKVRVIKNVIELENFGTAPVMLTEVQVEKD